MAASPKLDVLITVITRFGATILTAISAIVVARAAGKEGLGLFALLRAVPAVLHIPTELGVSRASPYLINNRKIEPQKVLGNVLLAGTISCLVSAVIWLAASGMLEMHLLRGLPIHWIRLGAMIAPLMILNVGLQSVLRALHEFRFVNGLRIAKELGILVVLGCALFLGWGFAGVLVICILCGQTLSLVLGVLKLLGKGLRPVPALHKALLRESLRFGIKGQIGGAMHFLNYRLDHLILGFLANPGTVGIYVVASKAAELFRLLPSSIGFVLEPRIAGKSPPAAIATVKRLAPTVFLMNLLLMAAAYFVGPAVIPFIFKQWSAQAITPFRILLVGLTAMGATGVFSSFNLGQGRPETNTYAVGMAFIATVVLDVILIPIWSVNGAAVASSCAYTASAVALAVFFLRRCRQLEALREGMPT